MEFKIGEIYQGKITGITKFGVFVDLGDNTSGMVHISEVARSFVNDINEHVKMGEEVKVKVLSISDEGKIALSIKKALEPERSENGGKPRERRPRQPQVIDSSYTWTAKRSEPEDFEDMMNRFKQTSDEKFSDLKRKNPETRRSKRGANVR
ncbi:MAG: S1 RNA-binding domain-containing protein [Clostridia bacterium]|nr:S1 RNA-binding domain-containing protein [Clostridia bacterium]